MQGEVRKTAISHIDALDGARGVAVAGVLLFHGGHLTGGYLGVDFFFTLSGFLITSLLLAESGRTGSIGLGGFWARRARRLLPALAVLLVGVALYSVAVAGPDQVGQIRGDALATLGYVANWHEIFSHQNYFALFVTPSPLNHTWSLAIEEQFYVVWPLVFVCLLTRFKRSLPTAVLVTSLALAAVSSVLMIVLYHPTNATRAYFGTDTRAAAILFGAALAAWTSAHPLATDRRRRQALEIVGITGAAVLAVAWTRLDGQSSTLYRGGFLLCGLAATAVIAATVHPVPGPLSRVLSLRPLCALGLISYGVYLYHWPIDVFLDSKRVGVGGWWLFGFQTAVTLGIAIASYRFLEQPIRHGALSAAQLRKLTPALAIGLVVVIVGATTGARAPLDVPALSRHPVLDAQRAYALSPPGSQRVMIVGDSVAYDLGISFKSLHAHPPVTTFNEGLVGCIFPPQLKGGSFRVPNGPLVLYQTACDPPFEGPTVKAFRPNVVFWVVSDPRGGTLHGKPLTSCTAAYNTLYEASLRREVAILGKYGATVAITTAAYDRSFAKHNDIRTACDNILRRRVAAATGAKLVDLFEYTCPKGQCRTEQDGVTLRPDGLHYQGRGGEIVAQWMLDQVKG